MRLNTKELLLTSFFAALCAIGAFIRIPIPFYPVPFSLQTLCVMLAGLLLPWRAALLSQLVYVVLGLIGLPIFTNGGGLGYALHPTFGYLFAFILAAPLCSVIASKADDKKLRWLAACFCCSLIINTIGVIYMLLLGKLLTGDILTIRRALYLVAIFIPLDIIKAAICIPLCSAIKKRILYFRLG